MTTNDLRKLVKQLQQSFPVTGRVVVSRRPITKDCARTNVSVRNNAWTFRIYIDSKQESGGQIDSLLHEWAHIVAIQEACDHNGRWATAYGEIYTSWERGFPATTGAAVPAVRK